MLSLSVGRVLRWFILKRTTGIHAKRGAKKVFFRARSPRKKTSRERRSRREPEKNCHFGALITHFLREKSPHT